MTDQPATTPAADPPTTAAGWAIPDLTQAEKDDLMAALAERKGTAATARVTVLTLRCGQLREQRDIALRTCVDLRADLAERDRTIEHLTADRDEARRERDEAYARGFEEGRDYWRTERDEARAQAVAATTDADDLRARVEAIAGDLWRDGCDCGHRADLHTLEAGCVGGLALCKCNRTWPSIAGDRLRKALDATQGAGIAHRAASSASVDPNGGA